jgi:gamma-glutamyl-gamma-aminobutyrate hydrolase PuuD
MKQTQPVIGITCHLAMQPDPSGNTRGFHRLSAQYTLAILAAGGLPMLLGTAKDYVPPPMDVIAAIDGLLLSGGTDLPAGSFSDNPRPTLRETDPGRYDYEVELVREAWHRGVPMMGICRGHQTLAEALGGRLVLNIMKDNPQCPSHYQREPPTSPSHAIITVADTRLKDWLGEKATVNSFHRQAVVEPPAGFVVSARSGDHLVEAIEAEGRFALGLQFHPEWMFQSRAEFLRPFQTFVQEADGFLKKNRRSR